MLTLKCIDEKIEKLEKEAKSLILKALHDNTTWNTVKQREEEINSQIAELRRKKLELIPYAKEFVDFVFENYLNLYNLIDLIEDSKIVQAINLFSKIPLKHRKFVLEEAYIESEAKSRPQDEDLKEKYEKWLKRVYKPLKVLTRQSKIGLTPHEKAKLLDALLEKAGIDVFTFKQLLEREYVELRISPFAEFEELSEDDKVKLWLRSLRD
jgi:hypothetical protein